MAKKVHISLRISPDLLKEIDLNAKGSGENRSRVLLVMLKRCMQYDLQYASKTLSKPYLEKRRTEIAKL